MSASARTPSVLPVDPSRFVVRRASERGHLDHGWLDTSHTCPFGQYYDPENMGFRRLRVINEDVVAPGTGFPTHPHREMEILTYVLLGGLAHRDSSGGGGVIRPGEVQHMTAGTGIRHSEANASSTEPVHFLQIWIEPTNYGRPPSYDQKPFPLAERTNRLRLVASPDAREGSLGLETDANVYATVLDANAEVAHENAAGRHVWIQVARGSLAVNGLELRAGDGLAVSDAGLLELVGGKSGAEVLRFAPAGRGRRPGAPARAGAPPPAVTWAGRGGRGRGRRARARGRRGPRRGRHAGAPRPGPSCPSAPTRARGRRWRRGSSRPCRAQTRSRGSRASGRPS